MTNAPTEITLPPGGDQNPEDYVYVAQRNWDRKQKIIKGQDGMLADIVGQPGPIAGVIINTFDAFVNFFARCLLFLLRISEYAFDLINNYAFGNFNGFLPNTVTGGPVFTYKFMRYIMTILMPPVGVFMSKGLYGAFNVFVCLIITYVNYIAGIVYAIVITMRNRYADQYEDYEYIKLKAMNPDPSLIPATDSTAFAGMIGFTVILTVTICLFLYWV